MSTQKTEWLRARHVGDLWTAQITTRRPHEGTRSRGEIFKTKAATSQYMHDTHIRLFAKGNCAGILDTMCFFKEFFISLRSFNQLDATSKVMYRHEIISTGNTAEFNLQ